MPTLSALPGHLNRRFVLVTGKGGVGKSTVTAVLGELSARAGDRTLVCEVNAPERMADLYGAPPSEGRIRQVGEHLFVVNIRPEMALEEYAIMRLRFRALYKMVFENPLVQSLVELVPGINDIVMLGKAFNHHREVDEDGDRAWDRIIVDAPATGHGVTFFRLPKVIRDAVPVGNMHAESAAMWDLLSDPAETAIHLVCLPEELPVQETRELHRRLTGELALPLGYLFLNQVPPPLLGPQLTEDFALLEGRPRDPGLGLLWDTTRIRLAQEARAAHYARELAPLDLPQVHLPTLYSAEFGRAQVSTLADHVVAHLEGR